MGLPCCTRTLIILAALLFVGGILSTIFFRSIVDWFIHKELVLRPDTEVYDNWKKPSVGPVTKIYFFNWTNPDEFRRGATPKFVEVGPYVYKETWEKKNVTFHPNATVSYETVKHYYFDRFKSKGTENDTIVTLNIPLVAAAIKLMKDRAGATEVATLNFLAREDKLESSVSRTVKELLWGYKCNLTKLAKPLQNLTSEDFGLLIGKNGSSDGLFTVYTGASSMEDFATISNWNGAERLPYWKSESCNALRGASDGSFFPPDLKRSTKLHLFNPDLCRALPLVYKNTTVDDGIEGYRFGPPDNVFDALRENPENECFCASSAACNIKGTFNVSACKFGAPIAISWPHFLHGDEKLLKYVEGLNPDKDKHEFVIDFHPTLSLPIRVKARMQINLHLSPVHSVHTVKGMRSMIFPIFWIETGIDSLPDDITNKLKMVVWLPAIAHIVSVCTLIGLGAIFLSVAFCLIWKQFRVKAAFSPKVTSD